MQELAERVKKFGSKIAYSAALLTVLSVFAPKDASAQTPVGTFGMQGQHGGVGYVQNSGQTHGGYPKTQSMQMHQGQVSGQNQQGETGLQKFQRKACGLIVVLEGVQHVVGGTVTIAEGVDIMKDKKPEDQTGPRP